MLRYNEYEHVEYIDITVYAWMSAMTKMYCNASYCASFGSLMSHLLYFFRTSYKVHHLYDYTGSESYGKNDLFPKFLCAFVNISGVYFILSMCINRLYGKAEEWCQY